MTTPSITAPLPVPHSLNRALRILLAGLAIAALLAVAFVVGRVTTSSTAPTGPVTAPAGAVQAPPAGATGGACLVHTPTSPC